ncbi:MAG: ATPase [Proteobacteria bacterium]|nr:ATPase [Pseudomonadota bacterium]MBU2618735.1 ATPase [Pseudomonadota bacterium]
MIVRMAKIAVIGPKELLLDVLAAIEQMGLLQIDQESSPEQLRELAPALQSVTLDTGALAQRLQYEELRHKIEALLAYLPSATGREYYLDNAGIARFLAEVIDKHLDNLRSLDQELRQLDQSRKELAEAQQFLEAISPLFAAEKQTTLLDHIGVSIRDRKALAELKRRLEQETGQPISIDTVEGAEGRLLGVITAEQEVANLLRKKLSGNLMLEHALPQELAILPVSEKIVALAEKQSELAERRHRIQAEVATFSQRWQGIYRHVRNWLMVQLTLLNATASVYQSTMCFFIFGWIPEDAVGCFSRKLHAEFAGKVTVEEKEILVRDLDRVPTSLHNPAYFQPFEIFSRLLPVPRYSSCDLTPYIGVFFPLFFGMMLGDVGYGLIVSGLGLALLCRWRHRKLVRDAGKIMVVCGVYAMIFGLLYGEFLGALGAAWLGLKPLLLARHDTILPMVYFSLAAGVVHISLALLLGGLSARRKKEPREAAFKFVSILFILCVSLLGATYILPVAGLWQQPLLTGLFILAPALLLTGGLLAPLEAIKHLGNIISYARIMAIGLTSVLLAYVANHLAGMTGSIWLGVIIGILLHGFNVLLGIFAPTVHALRLHYVEFFSKTMEKGGRAFSPLGKKNNQS